jgi:hypothetical protein
MRRERERERERETDMTKLIVALSNFTNAPKNTHDGYLLWPKYVAVLKLIKDIYVYIYIYIYCASD